MPDSPMLKVTDIHKSFRSGSSTLTVLNGVSFAMLAGEALAITGPSGSGKSTLLHLLGTLDTPDSGSLEIDGKDPFTLGETELARFRNRMIGFVFQDHHLLPQYSVLENVLVPALAFPDEREGKEARARELIGRVGLAGRIEHRPAELSGGERQRVAIARALINRPQLLLCDEPTGNLDQETGRSVGDLLFELHREANNLLVVVTHSLELAERFSRRLAFRGDRLAEVA